MPYCRPHDVRLIIKTQLSDTDLENLILRADAKINAEAGIQTEGNQLAKDTSALMVAKRIRQSDPNSFAIGGYSESNRDPIQEWTKEIEENLEVLEDTAAKHIFRLVKA